MTRRLAWAVAVAAGLAALVLAATSAHPLGNFTINHYAGIRVGPDTVLLDFVLDRAEIPTFQEVRNLDPNRDGTIDPAEAVALRGPACMALAPLLDLRADASPLSLELIAAGLSFSPGAGGLPTMRLVCTFRAPLPAPAAASATLAFEDRTFPERIGWREITVAGDGTTIGQAGGGPTSIPSAATASERLTTYPTDLLATPLDVRSTTFAVASGGPALPPLAVPDATPISADGSGSGREDGPGGASAAMPIIAAGSVADAVTAAEPGGVGTGIAGLLEARDLTAPALALSLLAAALLGAGHALTPGHGKTVMAAYPARVGASRAGYRGVARGWPGPGPPRSTRRRGRVHGRTEPSGRC